MSEGHNSTRNNGRQDKDKTRKVKREFKRQTRRDIFVPQEGVGWPGTRQCHHVRVRHVTLWRGEWRFRKQLSVVERDEEWPRRGKRCEGLLLYLSIFPLAFLRHWSKDLNSFWLFVSWNVTPCNLDQVSCFFYTDCNLLSIILWAPSQRGGQIQPWMWRTTHPLGRYFLASELSSLHAFWRKAESIVQRFLSLPKWLPAASQKFSSPFASFVTWGWLIIL